MNNSHTGRFSCLLKYFHVTDGASKTNSRCTSDAGVKGIKHFGPKTVRTQNTSALAWWVKTVRTFRHSVESVQKTVQSDLSDEFSPYGPKYLTPRTEVIFWVKLSVCHRFKRPYTKNTVCIVVLAKTTFTYSLQD